MTVRKDPPKIPAIVPEVIGPDVRPVARRERPDEFGAAGQGRAAVYQGERPLTPYAPPVPQISVKQPSSLKAWGLNARQRRFLMALPQAKSKVEAFRIAFPKNKLVKTSEYHVASRLYAQVVAKMGEEEMYELLGIGKFDTMKKLGELKDAQVVKAFIVPETGEVVEAGPYPDNTTQLGTAKLLAQMNRMVDPENKGGGAVIVNIVQYNPPGTPTWPGGGRV
jgi:hypothetical protein